MARTAEKLTARSVTAKKRPGFYGDGKGLWLQVSPGGTKSWVFRFNSPTRVYGATDKAGNPNKRAGMPRECWMGLGSVVDVSLADARQKAQGARRLLDAGTDPIVARDEQEAAKGLAMTFQEAAEQYIADHRPSWKNPKHAAQWPATLKAYVYPVIGALPVAGIETGAIHKILRPIWSGKPETAGRVRGRIELVLDWATARGARKGENPARWRGHLDKLLPARKRLARIKHHPAMPYVAIGDFIKQLRSEPGPAARALEFTILCATRTNETLGATLGEIDKTARVWTIPPERMKGGKTHRVPLSARAVEIVEEMEALGERYIFPGRKKNDPLSDMTMLAVLRRLGHKDLVVHGFRSTFRDWCAEQTNFAREVAEAALAHANADKVEASYLRTSHFEKRRQLMELWCKYCGTPAAPAADNVHPLREQRA